MMFVFAFIKSNVCILDLLNLFVDGVIVAA